jgi:hypothetical protein
VHGFKPAVRDLLLHMILSHHGSLEYGSPKVPVFLEAMLLHQLDTMDAKMECMRASVERDRQVEGVWTGYIGPLERSVLKKEKFLGSADGSAPAASTPPAAPAVSAEAPRPDGQASPHSQHSTQHSSQQQPAQQHPQPESAAKRQPSTSPFASKLQEALTHEQ